MKYNLVLASTREAKDSEGRFNSNNWSNMSDGEYL